MFFKRLGEIPNYQIILSMLPIVGLLLPNGIPFTYGACGYSGSVYSGSVLNPRVDHETDCLDAGGNPIIDINNCTENGGLTKCELTLTCDLVISQYNCAVYWRYRCSEELQGPWCASGMLAKCLADPPPCTFLARSATGYCTAAGDPMKVEFYHPAGGPCDCGQSAFVSLALALGTCNPPPP